MKKDNQMNRGVSQALYKYLPESWIDFSVRGKERQNYTAKVVRWNSVQLDGVNKKRVIRLVNNELDSFSNQATDVTVPPLAGFGAKLDVDNCDVLTPKCNGVERGIVADISPLVFYCRDCNKVYKFKDSEAFKINRKCRNGTCRGNLIQFRQIFYHRCGNASADHNIYCPNCKSSDNVYYYGGYDFKCKKCNKNISMNKKCTCGDNMLLKPALDPAQYFPFSLSFIDLVNEENENYISETDYGAYTLVLNWLGKINKEDLVKIKKTGIVNDNNEYERIFKESLNMFLDNGFPDELAKQSAKVVAQRDCGNSFKILIDELKTKICISENDLKKFAEMVLEYDLINSSIDISTIEDAKSISKKLNTNANPDLYDELMDKYGISNAKVCGSIPIVSCSYGYTREKNEYDTKVQLRAFIEEHPGRKNVYANRLNTEGVIFEFDRKKILKWMVENEYLEEKEFSQLDSEEKIKLWFINHVNINAISTFTPIDENVYKYTKVIYSLIHSISHLLMKSVSELCGLDKDSISEYIFPGIPAVLIYCQNSQGFNLGALFNTFEAYFDKWLITAAKKAKKCVYDPICIDRYKACTGCLFTNEISCQHFNKDLDRQLLIGYYDRQHKKKIKGFWEE